MKFSRKPIRHYPSNFRHVATLPWEIKNSNFVQMCKKMQRNCILIASNFVIHPQSLIFSVIANKIFHVTVLLLVYICDQFLAPKIRHSRHHCSVCQQSTWYSATRQDVDKKFVFEGVQYTADRLTKECPEKSLTKPGATKLLKTLQDTGKVDRRPGNRRPRSSRTEENVETVNHLGPVAPTPLKRHLTKYPLKWRWCNGPLVLSQEDKRQTHRTVREIPRETRIHWCTQNAICLYFLPYLLTICRKFKFLISQGSVATSLR